MCGVAPSRTELSSLPLITGEPRRRVFGHPPSVVDRRQHPKARVAEPRCSGGGAVSPGAKPQVSLAPGEARFLTSLANSPGTASGLS